MQPARSTELRFSASASSSKSKYEPDASFIHDDAQYPGVIIEVAYSQKKNRLGRLAENYILDSDASVRVVIGLDIEYGKESRKAALSIWRPELFQTADGLELRAVEEATDEVGCTIIVLRRFIVLITLPTRFSVTMKETPSDPLAYGSVSAISAVKNSHRRN